MPFSSHGSSFKTMRGNWSVSCFIFSHFIFLLKRFIFSCFICILHSHMSAAFYDFSCVFFWEKQWLWKFVFISICKVIHKVSIFITNLNNFTSTYILEPRPFRTVNLYASSILSGSKNGRTDNKISCSLSPFHLDLIREVYLDTLYVTSVETTDGLTSSMFGCFTSMILNSVIETTVLDHPRKQVSSSLLIYAINRGNTSWISSRILYVDSKRKYWNSLGRSHAELETVD